MPLVKSRKNGILKPSKFNKLSVENMKISDINSDGTKDSENIFHGNYTEINLKKRGALEEITNVATHEKICNTKNKKDESKLKLDLYTKIDHMVPDIKTNANNKKSDIINNSNKSKHKSNLLCNTIISNNVLLPEINKNAYIFHFDDENSGDPSQVSEYAMDIFNYYHKREENFPLYKYMDKQTDITDKMRAILVDWMVEIQESFELNHETLYVAIKLLDLFLSQTIITKDVLQLVGSTALMLACKFEERLPPLVRDFIYICDDAYTLKELLNMEQKILVAIDFQLNIPVSYEFLRRYARCAKINLETLTLARYILELSLLDYNFVDVRGSQIAGAALLLALQMKNMGSWTPVLQYYSSYTLEDIYDLCHKLYHMMDKGHEEHLNVIHSKYSHRVFFEVAKIPLPPVLNL